MYRVDKFSSGVGFAVINATHRTIARVSCKTEGERLVKELNILEEKNKELKSQVQSLEAALHNTTFKGTQGPR